MQIEHWKSMALIVDDNPTNLNVLIDTLSHKGLNVSIATSGKEALNHVEGVSPDLILLDVLMPEIDGFEVCRRLKENDATRDIPVIFMTALTETVNKVKGFDMGGVDYVTKPFQYEEVVARVMPHLKIRHMERRLHEQNMCLQHEIVKRKQAEEALQKAHDELEIKVKERTAELQEAKEAALKAQRASEAANYAKSIFLMNVTHELRTPLTSILGFAQILRKDMTLTEFQQSRLEKIEQSGWRLLKLINDILDMSSIDICTIRLQESNFRFPEFLADIAEKAHSQTQQKGLEFCYDVVSDLPPIVRGDEHRLRQVLLSLLNNAVKFTEQGSVTLRVEKIEDCRLKIEHCEESGNTTQSSPGNLQFSIIDTGIGIPESLINDIFEPFNQVAEGFAK